MKAEGRTMSRRTFKVCVVIAGLALIMGMTAKTVSGKEQKPDIPTTDAYECMETAYLTEVKAILAENHYGNSGVNMTKVIDADENRSYTIEIYHSRLNGADAETKQMLLDQLEILDGFGRYCTIDYKI